VLRTPPAPRLRHALAGLASLIASVAAASAPAPTFTRVTDPANPVVTEAFESGGGSWCDLDGDGLPELFVAHGNLSNQDDALFRNLGGMQFARVTTGTVVHDGGSSIGGTWGDFDNDGHPDLFVTNRNFFGNFLYRGLGDTLFDEVLAGPVVTDLGNSNSSSWVDVDGDGDLDLYVVNFNGDDFLYVNGGAPGFALVRVIAPPVAGTEFSIVGAWGDVNDDNRPDLFVGNAGAQDDRLWINQGGLDFTGITLADGRASLGASWGDYDEDGQLDLFVANFTNQASLLYRNAGPPTYALVPVAAGALTTDLANSVGSAWGDVDDDGDLDLFVARDGQACGLYLNDGPPGFTFTKVTTGALVTTVGNSFGASLVDVDGDGHLDVFVANRLNQPDFLFRNDGNALHWLAVRCTGTASNRSAIGARVTVFATIDVARRLTREVAAQTGYNSQVLALHFGLGDAAVADSIVVRWPSGALDVSRGVPADRRVELVEGQGVVSVPTAPAPPGGLELRLLQSGSSVEIRWAIPAGGPVSLELFDVRGRRVATLEDGPRAAGAHATRLPDAAIGPPGLYFCRLRSGGATLTRKLVHTRGPPPTEDSP